nr:MAG TPA: hypothetical protein [Caudoviricetes sp.]
MICFVFSIIPSNIFFSVSSLIHRLVLRRFCCLYRFHAAGWLTAQHAYLRSNLSSNEVFL